MLVESSCTGNGLGFDGFRAQGRLGLGVEFERLGFGVWEGGQLASCHELR